jgi:hypothetical protein
MMFATFVLEKEPDTWHDFPVLLETWTRSAGGFATVGLIFYFLVRWLQRSSGGAASSSLEKNLSRLFILGIVVGYGGWVVLNFPRILNWIAASAEGESKAAAPVDPRLERYALLTGAISALLAVALPFMVDLFRLRWRRIWAMARLSMKEAVRRRVVWVFSSILLLFLFYGWFHEAKPENQVRDYVHVVFWGMTALLLLSASLIAAFSIPADIRSNNIHTIVTKPVERFEIVLGRFLGYMMLMTIVQVVMTGLCLLYLVREVDPEAKFESMKARVPIYGDISFIPQGDNVGREWEYRKYIAGGRNTKYSAIWTYNELPAHITDPQRTEPVKCEFTFDVFRTLKGEEGKGVFCSFLFRTNRWDHNRKTEYENELEDLRRKGASSEKIGTELAEKYGVYQIPSKVVIDYATQGIEVPAALFHGIGKSVSDPEMAKQPALFVVVKCESGGQYLGMAKRDFYILDAERLFAANFIKGAIGLWLRMCIVVAIAIACSTYLSGIIGWLTTMFLYVVGFFLDYAKGLAEGKAVGGGPMESMVRLFSHESMVSQLDQTPGTQMALGTDEAYRWILRQFLNIIPDVERFSWTDYVAEGFNISTSGMLLLDAVMLAGYLLPWAILAYYLMKTREIATY